jgi:hypothetical protein
MVQPGHIGLFCPNCSTRYHVRNEVLLCLKTVICPTCKCLFELSKQIMTETPPRENRIVPWLSYRDAANNEPELAGNFATPRCRG